MSANIDTESLRSLITLTEAAKLVPPFRNKRPVHAATLSRWRTKGVVGQDGNRIQLRAVRTPGGWRTSPDWLAEFFDALAKDKDGEQASSRAAAPVLRSPVRRQRELTRARTELAKVGI